MPRPLCANFAALGGNAFKALSSSTALCNVGGPQMMVPTSSGTFPDGIMNVHDAT
jgi:hypothetical protein